MRTDTLPADFHARYGSLRFVRKRGVNEYSAECPECSDSGHIGPDWPDRFRMFTTGKQRSWCRSCGFFEFLDSVDKRSLTVEEMAAITRERTALAKQDRERVRDKIADLEMAAEWRGYHAAMQDTHREMWRKAGIPDDYQDYWEFGYRSVLKYKIGDEIRESPALTIPYFHGGHIRNVQMRLLEPAVLSDKYRFTSGLPAPVYLPNKEDDPTGRTLLTEGAKKAAVTHINLGGKYNVVGIPSKTISRHQIETLSDCDPIILCLDPDANDDGTSLRNAELLGKERCKIATLPEKIDDAFVQYGIDALTIDRFIRQARRVT